MTTSRSKRARTSDPWTSHLAAASVEPHIGRMQARVLGWIGEAQGMTATELAKWKGVDVRDVNRRTTELERKGQVRRGEARKDFYTGRAAATWWLTETDR